tara:strand:+ start:4445 stop:4663 length:219 start_codon:yes stop_codon:yes gene_type:complete
MNTAEKKPTGYYTFENLYVKVYEDNTAEVVNITERKIENTAFGSAFDHYPAIDAEEYAEVRSEVNELINSYK